MFGIMRWRGTARTLSVSLVLAMLLNLGGVAPSLAAPKGSAKLAGRISEASPPEVIQQLKPLLDKYQPQVSIASPRPNEVVDDNTVSVKFNVKDLPLYKDAELGLGPHLHVFLDDQPYQAVYDVSQPLVLKDLAAGTHTIRAFAGRPWHESFKNDGAYAQTTFHVFTKTPSNSPDPKLPLLTYSRPQATYGAEPVLLDFYLTNAPLHIVAQEDSKDEVADWRVKVTVNGDSFTLDRWQPIYLKGFKPGKNWVQLEYVDDKGNPVQNVYNNAARIFNYELNGQDTLSRLVRGEIPFDQAVSIVDPNYKPTAEPSAPEPTPVPVAPAVEKAPTEPEVRETPQPIEEAPKPAETPKPQGGFFNRFKRSEPKPSVAPSPEPSPEPEKAIAPEPEKVIELPASPAPEPEAPEIGAPVAPAEKPQGGFFNRFKRPAAPVIAPSPEPEVTTEPEKIEQPEVSTPETPVIEPEAEKTPESIQPAPEAKEAPKGGFFDRFKRSESKPTVVLPSPTPVPDDLTAPEAAEPVEAETVETEPAEPEQIEIKPAPVAPVVKEAPKGGFFDRFKRSESKPEIVLPSPTPIPDDLSAPEMAAPIETKPTEAEGRPEPLGTPVQEAKPPAVQEPVKSAPEATSSEFEPQTELERRLGMPLKPRISQPPVNPQPALSPESAE
ncbi:hypothetical protein H6F51_24065 [Cyanobacteria bacterium FACHB-DQ100]|nr:hypothetical protein [Cyanobacteria bacterium FACHB-DQ100]